MLITFLYPIPEDTLIIKNLLKRVDKDYEYDPKLCQILLGCHLLERTELSETTLTGNATESLLNDQEKKCLQRLGRPEIHSSTLAFKEAIPNDFENQALKTKESISNGERYAFRHEGKNYCMEPDYDAIKNASNFAIFLTEDKEFIIIFNSIPKNQFRDTEHIDKKRKSRPGIQNIRFQFDALEVEKWSPGTMDFFGKFYQPIPSKDRFVYYDTPIRIGYANDNPMFSVRSKIEKIAMERKINKIKLTLAGFGIGAGRAEIASISDKSFCGDWDIKVYAFNSPYLFVGQKGIDEFIKIVGRENYHPIQAHIPNAPIVKETFSEAWFRGCGFKKPQPERILNLPDINCRWVTQLQYRRTMPWHHLSAFLRPR